MRGGSQGLKPLEQRLLQGLKALWDSFLEMAGLKPRPSKGRQ